MIENRSKDQFSRNRPNSNCSDSFAESRSHTQTANHQNKAKASFCHNETNPPVVSPWIDPKAANDAANLRKFHVTATIVKVIDETKTRIKPFETHPERNAKPS